MKDKKQVKKKKWEKPAVKTLPFKNTLGGAIRYTYEDAFYS
jgi:hypothetical protein